MVKFIGLTKRNILVFFKDKQAVVFSLLTSIIVFVLYLLFLKSSFTDAINNSLKELKGLEDLVEKKDVDMYVNMILLVGVLGSALITVPYNCLSTLIQDREKKVDYDILATPIKRWQIILSYYTSAVLSSILLTSIIFAASIGVLNLQGNTYMSALDIVSIFGIIILGAISATSIFMIPALMFKSTSASSGFFGILSAVSGFIIGAYIPISEFSKPIQNFCNVIPATHITILLRNKLQNGVLNSMDKALDGKDGGLFVKDMKKMLSFKAKIFDTEFSHNQTLLFILAVSLLFTIALMIIYSKTYKRK